MPRHIRAASQMNNRHPLHADSLTPLRSVPLVADSPAVPLTKLMTVSRAFFTLADPVVAQVTAQARELELQGDAETLHKLRVAMRRLRALWWAFTPLMDSAHARLHRDEFKRLAGAAGGTRDWDVLSGLLASDEEIRALARSVAPTIVAQRVLALSCSRAALRSKDVEPFMRGALLATLRHFEKHGDEPIADFAETRVRKAEKALRSCIKHAHRQKKPDYDALHDVRIAGKKLRYLLEFFAPLLKGRHEKVIKRLTTVQTKLGDLNDVVVSEVKLRDTPLSGVSVEDLQQALNWMGGQKKRHLRAAHRHLARI